MPMGLDALDMLRIESGLIFAGYEFDDQTDPFEAGIGFAVALQAKANEDFIGKEALMRRKEHPSRTLVGLELAGNEPAAHGDPVHVGRSQVGVVTSAMRSPILRKNIALCRMAVEHAALGTAVEVGKLDGRHCQTKANRYPKVVMHPPSGRKLAPLGQGSGAVLLEDVAAVEVAILVEVVVKRGMDGSELLKGLHVPELRHRPLSSPQRLMRIFGPVVEPATALLSGSITDHVHCRTV